MKKLLSRILYAVAIILSYLMCIVVTYRYCSRLCSIDTVARFPRVLLIIFLVAIIVCIIFGIRFDRQSKQIVEEKNAEKAKVEETVAEEPKEENKN
jgi:predicted membrane protein